LTDTTSPAVPAADEIAGGAVRITKAGPAEQVRVILFYLGETAYTVPKKIPANLMFDMMRVWRRAGPVAAQTFMFEEALEPEALAELSSCEGLTKDDLKSLMQKLSDLYAGDLDEYLGK
jgi:hypothetical protein